MLLNRTDYNNDTDRSRSKSITERDGTNRGGLLRFLVWYRFGTFTKSISIFL